MATYNPAMQKATLADVPSDVHGVISKRTAELDGVSVTEVTFAQGARWSKDLKDYAGAWSVGEQACTFIEFSRGNDYFES